MIEQHAPMLTKYEKCTDKIAFAYSTTILWLLEQVCKYLSLQLQTCVINSGGMGELPPINYTFFQKTVSI